MIDSSDSIKLPALGRCVQVGDTYNYFNDTIATLPNLKVPDDCIQIDCKEIPDTKLAFLCQKSDDFIYYLLDINSHLRGSIEKKTVQDLNPLWFSHYVNTKTNQGDEGRPDRIDVFLRVIRRTETLSQDFIQSKLFNYQLQSGGKATHLVEQVSYGAEFICSVDLSQEARSEDVEDEILTTVKVCFQQILEFDSKNDIELPSELEKINCTLYSSLFKIPDAFNKGIGYSFSDAIKSIRDLIHSSHREDPLKTWSPIEMNLRQIPAQLEAQIYIETMQRSKLTVQLTMSLIKQNSKTLLKNSALNKVPVLKQVLSQFVDLLQPLRNKIENNYSKFPLSYIPDQLMEQHKLALELIKEMEEWLGKISQQIKVFSLLLKDINLDIWSLDELESRTPTSQEKYAKVFVLKVHLVKDKLLDKIKKTICREEELNTATFPEFFVTVNTVNRIREMLIEFEGEAVCINWSDSNPGYYIGLVPANITELVDGSTTTIKYRAPTISEESTLEKSSEISKEPNKINCEIDDLMDNERQCIDFPEDEDMSSFSSVSDSSEDVRRNHTLIDYTKQDTESVATTGDEQNKHVSKVEAKEYQTNTTSSYEGKSDPITESPKLEFDKENVSKTEQHDVDDAKKALVDSLMAELGSNSEDTEKLDQKQKSAVNKSKAGNPTDVKKNPKEKRVKTFRYDKRFQQAKEEKILLEDQRIENAFEKDKNAHHKLIKQGKPSVYLLNAKESSISKDLRWFSVTNIGGDQPSLHSPNHKVVILMGATGCGKSTLINGMFNYILGVQWKDPNRYKVIREDESSTSRDQSHSQTSSVTAYTLEHRDGMAVPYSITIIDTPGYGDTRGIKRDKEITKTIHRFLSQSDTQFDKIHAVCFVAASGDSRLTATQRYILDSVLSLFGKDVKDNIRLLVTFADSADPPVIEACMAAHFPLTPQSNEIMYSKFNSSVLYASNQQSEEDDFSFDKLFWDMGQENFSKFFKMLRAMNGCDLSSTREVIQSRQKAEQALKNIENEMNVCLNKIENMEKWQRKINEHGRKMDTNKNFNVEVMEPRSILVQCGIPFWMAYNCKECKQTCQPPKLLNKLKKFGNDISLIDKPECYSCKCSKSDHEYEHSEWLEEYVPVSKTLHEMKSEYESNCKQKFSTETLLNKCTEDMEMAKVKLLSLLSQLEENSRSLDSTALRSNALLPVDYLHLMRSRVAEEQKPGYMIRLETLSELQRCLSAEASSRLTKVQRESRKN